MLSFQRVLREKYDVHWERKRLGTGADTSYTVSVIGSSGTRVFKDDRFGSVTGYIQALAVKHYTAINHFVCAPVVQSGHGVSFADIFVGFDSARFRSVVVETLRTRPGYNDLTTAFDNARAAYIANETDVLAQSNFIEAMYNFLVTMRSDDELDGLRFDTEVVLPFIHKNEMEAFLTGEKKGSFKSEKPISEKLEENIVNFYDEGKMNDDRTEIIYTSDDPFVVIGSELVALPKTWNDIWTGVTTVVPSVAKPSAAIEPVQDVDEPDGVDVTQEQIDAAASYLVTYWSKRLGGPKGAPPIEMKFGSKAGEAFWETVSQGTRQKFAAQFKDGRTYTMREVLAKGIAFLSSGQPCDPVMIAQLVAARVRCCSQNFKFNPNAMTIAKV